MLTYQDLLDIMNSQTKQQRQQTKFKEGGTDHRKQNVISHNLRKRGTDHQKRKMKSSQFTGRGDTGQTEMKSFQ